MRLNVQGKLYALAAPAAAVPGCGRLPRRQEPRCRAHAWRRDVRRPRRPAGPAGPGPLSWPATSTGRSCSPWPIRPTRRSTPPTCRQGRRRDRGAGEGVRGHVARRGRQGGAGGLRHPLGCLSRRATAPCSPPPSRGDTRRGRARVLPGRPAAYDEVDRDLASLSKVQETESLKLDEQITRDFHDARTITLIAIIARPAGRARRSRT